MQVVVCGSRSWSDRKTMRDSMNCLLPGTLIIDGAAKGADQMAYEIAVELGFPTQRFPADWGRYGRSAGYKRNIQMLEEKPDLVIAFWDGESRGTAHTIREAEKRGIPVEVIRGT